MGSVRGAAAVIVLLGCPTLGAADETAGCTAMGKADRTTVTIGEPIRYIVTVDCPTGAQLAPPSEKTAWAPFEVRDMRRAPPSALPGGRVRDTFEYVLTVYQTGRQTIPPVSMTGLGGPGNVQAKTEPVIVTVESVNPSGRFDDIHPLKEPIAAPPSHWPWWLGGILAGMAVAAGAFAWRVRQGRRRVDALPPWVVARDALSRLSGQRLIEQGAVKEHYDRLSDILRAYLAVRYQVAGMDHTTDELIAALRERIDPSAVAEVQRLLSACDLVKFADYRPSPTEHESAIPAAQRLIDRTIPHEAAQPVRA